MAGDLVSSSTHPPLPPTTEDIRYSHLRLLRSRRVGPATFHRLMTEHGTAQNALAALPEVARAAGVSDYEICPDSVIHAELKAAKRAGATLLVHGHAGYPKPLYDLDDAPPLLWAIGQTELLERRMLAIVGARNASSLGARMAKSLAGDLGTQGHVIVSGLARGIDAAAHLAALPTGTIAVLAGGVDVMYPAENTELAGNIGKSGLRLSEQPMGLQPMARHFPARNRIIAALGAATIVVEAAQKSGSLITARDALDIGRDVLAVPGHPFDARASGCNLLIRDGAILVRNAKDITEAIAPIVPDLVERMQTPDPAIVPLTQQGLRTLPPAVLRDEILQCLGPTPIPEDQLMRDLAVDPAMVSPTLTDLEMDGRIKRHSGGLLSRAS